MCVCVAGLGKPQTYGIDGFFGNLKLMAHLKQIDNRAVSHELCKNHRNQLCENTAKAIAGTDHVQGIFTIATFINDGRIEVPSASWN